MGRSGSNPHLTRRQNKERKEALKFKRVKKYRRQVLGQEKSKEHNKQLEVVGHNQAILKAKVLEVKRRKMAEKAKEQREEDRARTLKRSREDMEKDEEVSEDSIDEEAEDTQYSKTVPLDVSDEDGDADDAEAGDDDDDDDDDDAAADDASEDVAEADPAPRKKAPKIRITGASWIVASPAVVVREGVDLESAQVGRLENGTMIDLVEKQGRRGRIAAPLVGWVSVEAKDGATICHRYIESDDEGDDEDMDVADGDDGDDESVDTDDIDLDKGCVIKKTVTKGGKAGGGARRGGAPPRDRAAARREKKREKESNKRRRYQ